MNEPIGVNLTTGIFAIIVIVARELAAKYLPNLLPKPAVPNAPPGPGATPPSPSAPAGPALPAAPLLGNLGDGMKTYIGAGASALVGVYLLLDGQMTAGLGFLAGALVALGLGHKLEKVLALAKTVGVEPRLPDQVKPPATPSTPPVVMPLLFLALGLWALGSPVSAAPLPASVEAKLTAGDGCECEDCRCVGCGCGEWLRGNVLDVIAWQAAGEFMRHCAEFHAELAKYPSEAVCKANYETAVAFLESMRGELQLLGAEPLTPTFEIGWAEGGAKAAIAGGRRGQQLAAMYRDAERLRDDWYTLWYLAWPTCADGERNRQESRLRQRLGDAAVDLRQWPAVVPYWHFARQ